MSNQESLINENRRLTKENLQLKAEINKLLVENNKFKKLLNISKHLKAEVNVPNDTSSIVTIKSSLEDKIKLYRNLFYGRQDIFAEQYENKVTGKDGYSPKCKNQWKDILCELPKIKCNKCKHRDLKELSDKDIKEHLEGKKTLGIYPLLNEDYCKFLTFDFDDDTWETDIKALAKTCSEFDIVASIEKSRSGSGAHLWIFFSEKVLAVNARKLASSLLLKYTISRGGGLTLNSFDRIFPNQDKMPKGGFGNLIALPLQRIPGTTGNTLFVDLNFRHYKDQWMYLSTVRKYTFNEIDAKIKALEENLKLDFNIIKEAKESCDKGVYSCNEGEMGEFPEYITLIIDSNVRCEKTLLTRELLNLLKFIAS